MEAVVLPCEQVEVMLQAQCLSNPLPWREDGSVRGSVQAPQAKPGEAWNTLQNLQASTQLTHAAHTHLGTGTHPLPGHTHTVYLSFPLCFPAQGSYSQMTSRLSGSANCTLFVDSGWFFHALKALLESPAMLAHIGVRMVNLRRSLKLWGGWMWGGTQDNMKHLYFVIGNMCWKCQLLRNAADILSCYGRKQMIMLMVAHICCLTYSNALKT